MCTVIDNEISNDVCRVVFSDNNQKEVLKWIRTNMTWIEPKEAISMSKRTSILF